LFVFLSATHLKDHKFDSEIETALLWKETSGEFECRLNAGLLAITDYKCFLNGLFYIFV